MLEYAAPFSYQRWTKHFLLVIIIVHRSNSAYNCTEYLSKFSRVTEYDSESKQLSFTNETYLNLTLDACLQGCIFYVKSVCRHLISNL